MDSTNNNKYLFSLDIKVRDYELDSEGIVNNAIYQHYLELTRHEFCTATGFSFDEMRREGIIPVVNRIEIDYRRPLVSGDVMESKLWVEERGVRFIFHQDIFHKASGDVVVNAKVSIVCLEDGKLSRGERLHEYFRPFLEAAKQ